MKDYILYQKLLKEVDEGRVSVQRSGDLAIFKYSQNTHIQGLWNDVNRQARGLILRTDGTVVARPFAKFFNLGEVEETRVENLPWHEEVEIMEKVDGSCGIGYYIDGLWRLATPGSMESDQAVEGTKILNEEIYANPYPVSRYELAALPLNCTPVFEIVYPENRIVVNYGNERELVLLAIFEKNGEEWHPYRVDQMASKCGFRRPRRYNIDLRSEIPFEENHEGYVARFASGLRVKVKSPAYLRVHRLLNYMSPKGVIDLIRGREYRTTFENLPQWLARDIDDIRAYVQRMHDELRIQSENLAAQVPQADRKTQALWIIANTPNALTGVVFGLLDKRDMSDKLWKMVLEKVKDEKTKVVPQE